MRKDESIGDSSSDSDGANEERRKKERLRKPILLRMI